MFLLRCSLLVIAIWFAGPARLSPAERLKRFSSKEYVALIQRLSEDPGFFDSDNLVSNESSYLQISGLLEKFAVKGGVYLGVGPEQNFTYIAKTRPHLAILLDIRRQNLLYHLLLKSLFDRSKSRSDYLAHLFSRPRPRGVPGPDRDIGGLLLEFEKTMPSEQLFRKNLKQALAFIQKTCRFPIYEKDAGAIEGIYREFFDQQLSLRFRSFGRPSFRFYPSFKDILLERDLDGQFGNFLNSEADFQFVKQLHSRNLIVPVVGDFAGSKAMRTVSEYLKERGETVSVFYVSNVEFYLVQNGVFDRFADNVQQLPISGQSLLIRAYFRFPHPQRRPGYVSATLLQRLTRFIENRNAGYYKSYQDVGLRDYLAAE
ncbi:MAG: hypothetical protein FJW26_12490 [Acidimicrobiia bacterium]|nr:hypothetical protein [Acidimicrobiia bacterium]